jgi:hypothetical protein
MFHQLKVSPAMQSERLLWGLSLVLCVAIKLIAMTGDRLDYDVYFMLQHTELPYFEYIQQGGFGKPLMTYGWFISRVFGSTIFSYRIIPFFLSVGALLFLAVGIKNRWADNYFMPIFCMLGLGINNWATYVLEYPIINYSVEVFLGVFLYLIFIDLAVSEISSSDLLRRVVPLIPLVMFASVTIVVPVCTGIVSLIIWRFFRRADGVLVKQFFRSIFSLWPLFSIPAIQLILFAVVPFKYLGKNLHYTLSSYFFNRSDYSQDTFGALGFALSRTKNWLRLVLLPVCNDALFSFSGLPEWPFYVFLLSVIVAVFGILIWYRKCDDRIVFTVFFVGLTWFVILCGGLASKFPYGTVRYTGWLLAAIVALIAYVLSECADFLSSRIAVLKTQKVLRFGVIGLGIVLIPTFYLSTAITKESNFKVLKFIRESPGDMVLVSFQVAPAVNYWLPDQRLKMNFMANPADMEFSLQDESLAIERFKEKLRKYKLGSILLTGVSKNRTAETHPQWMSEIDRSFELENESSSAFIWAGEYFRTNQLQHSLDRETESR